MNSKLQIIKFALNKINIKGGICYQQNIRERFHLGKLYNIYRYEQETFGCGGRWVYRWFYCR